MILSLQVRSSLPSEKCFGEASIFFWSLFEGEQPIVQRTSSLGWQRQRQKNTNKFNRKCFKDVFLETRGFKDLEYDIGYHQYKDKSALNTQCMLYHTRHSLISNFQKSWELTDFTSLWTQRTSHDLSTNLSSIGSRSPEDDTCQTQTNSGWSLGLCGVKPAR